MKRLAVCAIIAAVLIWGGIYSLNECEQTVSQITDRLNEVQILYIAGDRQAALEAAERACTEWEQFCDGSIFLTGIERSLEIQSSLVRISAMTAVGNDEVIQECTAAKRLAAFYYESRKPTAINIF